MTNEVTARVAAYDRLRGLIIVLMAIDHASYFIARVHPLETWATPPPYYPDLASFLTRWLTHLCAPGCFMLMGIGIVYFAESRRLAGWTDGRITRFVATRGAVLLLVQHFLENPAWLLGILSADPVVESTMGTVPGPGGETMLAFAVLSALGVAMIVGSVLWRAPWWVLVVAGVSALLVGAVMTPLPAAILEPQPAWKQLLFLPGSTGLLQNLYPWVPWLFPMVMGLTIARMIRANDVSMTGGLFTRGLWLIGMFVFARFMGTDPHPPADGLVGWLTVTKYPPSTAFLFLMLGLNLLLLAALAKWPARWLAPLEVFGRAPFFFYLAHLWAFGALSWAFPTGTSFPVLYLVWALVVGALYPTCAWYAQFKSSKPQTSLWRLF
ncbi:MAG: DUF1624 domain-containing protein [Acidimicrobiia bacterium]|nr:DUF1624 domain-containing protein [Acidimicrobiia bacterium]